MGRRKGGATGILNPNWKGGRHQDNRGYVHLKIPQHPNARKNGYVAEHTVVMTEALGRALEAGEIVHHINGITNDNRLENLIVLTNSTHIAHHTREHWENNTGIAKGQARRPWCQCVICHQMFQSRQAQQRPQKCCSIPCKHVLRKILILLCKSKPCKACGHYFYALNPPSRRNPTLFCSPVCYHDWRRRHLLDGTMRNRRMAPKTCQYCQKTFFRRGITKGTPRHDNEFCSRNCYHAYRKQRLAMDQKQPLP